MALPNFLSTPMIAADEMWTVVAPVTVNNAVVAVEMKVVDFDVGRQW